MTSPEQHFDRFRHTADAQALAAVFDALAPELLLVAAHVAPAGAEPEDLVQATFLDAIERAARWDAARPLMPWLIGILVNHARAERRRLQRKLEAGRVAHGRRAPRAERAPLDALAAGEVAEQVSEALRGVPRQYRQALTLRLVHGLTPTEIAHALGCPVSTVKTRLQRGLERLRQALPAGIAGSVAGVLTPGRGLAAVREVVLGHVKIVAPVAAGVAVAGAIGGGLLMKKVAVVAVAAVFAATLWFVTEHTGGSGAEPRDVATKPLLAQAEVSGAAQAAPQPAAPENPRADERVAVTVPAASLGSARLEFVWQDDGAPAAGLRLFVSRIPEPTDGGPVTVQAERHQSDELGLLALPELAPGSYSIGGRAFGHLLEVRAGEESRARVEVEPGLRLRGVVVDAEDRAVASASVWSRSFADPDEQTPRRIASTRDDGTFDAAVDFCGAVWATKPGFAPSRFQEPSDGGEVELRLVLGTGGCAVRGVVWDATGLPAEGAQLTIVRRSHADARHAPLSFTTDAGGRFVTDELDAGEHLLLARAEAHAPTLVRFTAVLGAQVLDVRLESGATVHGTVCDPAGAGVAGVVELRPPAGAEPAPLYQLRTMTTVCDARTGYRLEHVPTGTVRLRTFATGRADEERELQLDDGQVLRCDVVLGSGGVIRGRVLDQAGRPLEGWTVWANGRRVTRSDETASDGRFVLQGLADGDYTVGARPGDVVWQLPWATAASVRPGGGDVELRAPALAAGGRFVARLVDAAGQAAPRASAMVSPVDDPRGLTCMTSVEDADGELALGPLPPGSYRVRIRIGDDGWVDAGTHVLPAGGTEDLGRLRAPPAGTLVLSLRAPDGRSVEPAELAIFDRAGNGGALTERGSDGSWRSEPVPAGTYRVRGWGETFLPLQHEVTVVAERETPVELTVAPAAPVRFAFPRPVAAEEPVGDRRWLAQVQLLVRDSGGEVVAGHMLAVDTVDTFRWARGFAPGRYDYEAKVWPDGEAVRGTFEVPAGSLGQRVEVRLGETEAR